MRTLLAGLRVVQRAPRALLPLAAEGTFGAVLVIAGAFPASGASAPATAAFPFDVYFDLKQSIAFAPGWAWVVAAMGLGLLVRAAVLSSTLWLAEGAPGSFAFAWLGALRLSAVAAVALLPSAALFFTGVATRYAPFIWIAGALGLAAVVPLVRRSARLDVGSGPPQGQGVPEAGGVLAYALLLGVLAAGMSILGDLTPWLTAALMLSMGPFHALFLLGWREHLRVGTYPGGGTTAVVLTVISVGALFLSSMFDRYIRDGPPVGQASESGTLLILGGVDSPWGRGALAALDARDLGYARDHLLALSYRSTGPHTAADTRGDLDRIARVVAFQVQAALPPRRLIGHSQAALIVDRMLATGLAPLDVVVDLAPSPPFPPPVRVPPPGEAGPGKPGGDLARAVASLLDFIGATPFEIDAAASPTNLDTLVVSAPTDRLAVWALADSVWLDRDWRRPGALNLVALTDHVGVTRNGRALASARMFMAGDPVVGDESSWRGVLVQALRYAFEPWRPR